MQNPECTVYAGNLPKEINEAALHALFGHCGAIQSVKIAGDPTYDTRYAFVEFGHPSQAQTALLLDGMAVIDRVLKVNFAHGASDGAGPGPVRSTEPDSERALRTIHVGGLPMDDLAEVVLADYFAHVGEVFAVRKSGKFAWVEFTTAQAAQQALNLDGEALTPGSSMRIALSKTPIHTAGWRSAAARPASLGRSALPAASSAAHPAYPPNDGAFVAGSAMPPARGPPGPGYGYPQGPPPRSPPYFAHPPLQQGYR
ncbi:hypothetical protein WJX72_003168 [[Myrmecia] bisecta]|uniref:RRM domain-containing protein n=1 Tax=[Myrmecia] bisecta TaxID=41462 RepID=A0AAW1R4R8_9CHLO